MHVKVCILIPTRALPPMSYRATEALAGRLRVGSAVVVPLSGYSRLGIVVEMGDSEPDRPLETVHGAAGGLSLGPEILDLCRWISENAAMPLPVVLRNALPPGLRIDLYRVVSPDPDWSWRRGSLVERAALRRALGKSGLKEAESGGRVALSPAPARRESVEWVVPGEAEPDLSRAPRQRDLFEEVRTCGTCRLRTLLEESGARRETLNALIKRGAVRLVRRSGSSPVSAAYGSHEQPISETAEGILERRGAHLWRVPGDKRLESVAKLCRSAIERWEQTLILAPEIRDVESIVAGLADLLPPGATVAPYHSGIGRERVTVYEAARQGAVDVLVGTRAAALVPLSRPGAICVVDEPNPAHRAEPGFEGIPLHVRDLVLERGRLEESAVLMLSSTPSLSLYVTVGESGTRELPVQESETWPEARVVDMRGSGALLGRDLIQACREGMSRDGGVGVIVNRLGYATAVSCTRCGAPVTCESCGASLVQQDGTSGASLGSEMVCQGCAARTTMPEVCAECGLGRLVPTGLAVERARELLSERLGEKIGLITADRPTHPETRSVVGTEHGILSRNWDTVLLPDADSMLFGGGILAAEKGFRVLYSAAESAHTRVLAQTRNPDNAVLGTALGGDYPAFADHELPRRKMAGYPPYRHLAVLTLAGPESAVRRAIESIVEPHEDRVEALDPVPLAHGNHPKAWRFVLRAERRQELAEAASVAAEIPSATGEYSPKEARRIEIELDPEEV